MRCPFCAIVAGEEKAWKVYEDEKNVSFLDIYPVTEGHTLVIPKKHIIWFHDLTPEDAGPFFRAVWITSQKLKKVFAVDYISLLIRGTRIPHLHAHLIPKRKEVDNIFDKILDLHHYLQVRLKDVPSWEELEKIAERIREEG
jgi:histidine triad (HIT) family protein|uniref:HIT domain-containing protein n=1 Tax=candidate division WOR-3 bacterium TaxID=2052148 RepID=A0A7C3YP79_UNCW3